MSNKFSGILRVVFAMPVICLAGACASVSNVPSDETTVVSNSAVMWEDGLRAADTGEAMLTRGEKRLALGREQVREGETKVREGSIRVSQEKLEYEQAAMTQGGSTKAEKQRKAIVLRAIGVRWDAAIQDIKMGNSLIAKGNENIARGESEIREGRLLMETGSVSMRNAQRSRLGQRSLSLPTQ